MNLPQCSRMIERIIFTSHRANKVIHTILLGKTLVCFWQYLHQSAMYAFVNGIAPKSYTNYHNTLL